jgi:rRNA-processing protein FCF1
MDLFSSDRPKAVLLDTNILMYSASQPFDIAHMLNKRGITDIRVPSFVRSELEWLSRGSGAKEAKFAKLALQIALAFEPLETDSRGRTVDDKLVNLAQNGSYIVATADAPLRRRLTNLNIEVIYLKDGRLITA